MSTGKEGTEQEVYVKKVKTPYIDNPEVYIY